MTDRPIARYLEQLECELRVERAPRRRLLAEAADHLRGSAEDIAAEESVSAAEAERRAVERFGAAAVVARRFALAAASTSAQTTLIWVTTAFAAYAAASIAFVVAAPSWLLDFPQGAPSMLGLQVAFVALALSAVRALPYRRSLVSDETRLRLIANGMLVSAAGVAGAAGAELALALTRPAAAPWSDATALIALYTVAAVAVVAGLLAAVASAARANALTALPNRAGDATSPAGASLVEDVAAVVPPLTVIAAYFVRHPARVCALLAGAAFVAVTGAGFVGTDFTHHASLLFGAIAAGVFEAIAIVLAYLALGRTLGIRPA